MNGVQIAALLLAAAVLAVPGPARARLPRPSRPRPDGITWAFLAAAAVALLLMPPHLMAVGLLAGTALLLRMRRRRRERLRRREGQAVSAALEVLIGELKIGAHPARAFAVAASESVGRVADSLREVASRAQLGADVAGGMRSIAKDSPVPAHWQRLAVYWELAAVHGLAVSVLMGAAHRDIVDRRRFAEHVDAALAGARATAAILAVLPVLGVLLGQLIGAHPVRFLLSGGPGGVLLVVGVSLICLGVAWSDRITGRLRA